MTLFNRPTLVTITAPTCSGKSFLLEKLTKESDSFTKITSTTTRAQRVGEVEGVDYNFISRYESNLMEEHGEFAELIEFRGNRYGVTKKEMAAKMTSGKTPIIILEPKGLAIYEQLCRESGWGIYTIFISTVEQTRLERLNIRTEANIRRSVMRFGETSDWLGNSYNELQSIVEEHTSRVLSITGDERLWHGQRGWDITVSGDDANKAIDDIYRGIEWFNKKLK